MKKRIAVIELKKCRPEMCGRACIKVCPVNRMSKECIIEEPANNIIISEELCTGCGICVHKCPFGAIHIINLELDLQNPVHQYGKNRFRLYRLPLIREEETVGLIGKNGVGKSTIMNILTGNIIPNIGELTTKGNYENIIDYYKGKELQNIFVKLNEKTFKVSYKPQNIELLGRQYSEKVRVLLEKIDEKNSFDVVCKDLKLQNILERNINNLSGGELQKVAIAATLLKNAEVYFYDEPSSFLDIRQRFIFANIIQKYKNTNILIEHDLALLDYLSDYLHIIFGYPHVYGMVSKIKSTNIAINEFLDGFIKDENLRFRNYKIGFAYTEEKNLKKQFVLLTYPELIKKYDGFKLKVDEGKIYSGDVIGILGENGIGKSTFVKMLANIETPTSGTVNSKMRISYKPQSLLLNKLDNITVKGFLKETNQEILKSELWGKLNLEIIKDYNLNELNGGDLQKVFVAKCLATDADIYLIDEPSAYLDVEERLNVAKAIKNMIRKTGKIGFVVEHDILFIDYISDKLIVFEGEAGKNGFANAPVGKKEGMNQFLKILNISYRQDPASKRPRVNKLNSTKDQEQKKEGKYYIY